MLLSDEELLKLDPGIISGLDRSGDLYAAKSPIQPASVDLNIGNIYLPEVEKDKQGSIQNPLSDHYLKPGHTAIVETKEKLALPKDLAVIGFPPSSVSSQGLLMTNPGHVDPGYHGAMKFTVINMGREPYRLKSGEIIVTLLFFRLSPPAKKSYSDRNPNIDSNVTQSYISKLGADFLDVERRAEDVATKSERSARWVGIGVPVGVALISLGASFYLTYYSAVSRMNEFDKKMVEIKASLDRDISNINNKLERQSLEKRLEELEKLTKKGKPTSSVAP